MTNPSPKESGQKCYGQTNKLEANISTDIGSLFSKGKNVSQRKKNDKATMFVWGCQQNRALLKRDDFSIVQSPYQYEQEELSKVADKVSGVQVRKTETVDFDEILECNQTALDPFFTTGRHKGLDVKMSAQSFFESPKTSIRCTSNLFFFK